MIQEHGEGEGEGEGEEGEVTEYRQLNLSFIYDRFCMARRTQYKDLKHIIIINVVTNTGS